MEWGLIQHELLHALGQLHEHTRLNNINYMELGCFREFTNKRTDSLKRQDSLYLKSLNSFGFCTYCHTFIHIHQIVHFKNFL